RRSPGRGRGDRGGDRLRAHEGRRRSRARRRLLRRWLDGLARARLARRRPAASTRPPRARGGAGMTDAELAGLLREHALLEGDFVLRSGRRSSYYLDKYRFETRAAPLKEMGERIATRVRDS